MFCCWISIYPRMNGLEVLQKIKDEKIDVKILVLTVHNEVEYLLKAVDIGINGYLLKDSESSELKKQSYLLLMEKITYSRV